MRRLQILSEAKKGDQKSYANYMKVIKKTVMDGLGKPQRGLGTYFFQIKHWDKAHKNMETAFKNAKKTFGNSIKEATKQKDSGFGALYYIEMKDGYHFTWYANLEDEDDKIFEIVFE